MRTLSKCLTQHGNVRGQASFLDDGAGPQLLKQLLPGEQPATGLDQGDQMLGDLVLGHTYVGGGDVPEIKRVRGGLLGADYELANGRYRFARVYRGENWNPQLRAPLTQPGVNVEAGEFLLSGLHRIGSLCDSSPIELLGISGRPIDLAIQPGNTALQRVSKLTR